MHPWQKRRLVRSSILLLLLIGLLLYAWRDRLPRARRSGPARAPAESVEASGAWRVTPLVDTGYLPALIAGIAAAERSIDVSIFVIRPGVEDAPSVTRILNALGTAAARGVAVRVLLDRPGDASASHYFFNLLAAGELGRRGIEVKFDDAGSELHEKFVLFDDKDFIVGAHNWTEDALARNRELSLLVRPSDPLREIASAFEAAWEAGVSPALAAAGGAPEKPLPDVEMEQ